MAILTIRNLDDELKRDLRLQAAENERSMEEEARQILRRGVSPRGEEDNMAARLRRRFAGLGDLDLPILPRGKNYEPPKLE